MILYLNNIIIGVSGGPEYDRIHPIPLNWSRLPYLHAVKFAYNSLDLFDNSYFDA